MVVVQFVVHWRPSRCRQGGGDAPAFRRALEKMEIAKYIAIPV
jgi:hypothetical protein